jgi:Ca2+-binding EF-hand superfamily protein
MKQMQEKMFKAMDTNGDGKVDKNEMSAFQKAQQADGKQGGPSVDEIFKNSDSNSDGGITLQEMQDSMAKITQQMWSQSSSQDPSSTGSTSSDSSTSSTSSIDSLLKTLGTALQSGNTTDANTALTALEKLASSNSADSSSTSTSSTSSTDNPFLKDLQSIGSDLASGNTTDAQSVLASIQQKMHGHHGPPPPPDDSSSSSSTSSTKTSSNQIFDALDTNKDGTVSASELLAALSSKDSSSSDNSSSDTSSSSSSSSVDSSAVKKIFDAMDTNQDGSVSKSELEAALTKKGQHHQSQSTADSSSTTSTTDTAKTSDSALFAAAVKSYMQASFSSFSQNGAASALSASSLYA